MRVCVLGATGFVGRSCVLGLAAVDDVVEVVASHRAGSSLPPELAIPKVRPVVADICEENSIIAAVSHCDVCVNCIGVYRWWVPRRKLFVDVNEVGAESVARACTVSSVKRLVHISTAMSYGYPKCSPFDETSAPGNHASEYAASKHRGDLRVKAVVIGADESLGLSCVILHLGCVVGPGDTLAVGRPGDVCAEFVAGRVPMLIAPETQYIYVDIRDVVEAVCAVCRLPPSEASSVEEILVGNSDEPISTRGLFQIMARHCDRKVPRLSLNMKIAVAVAWLLTWFATSISGKPPLMPIDVARTANRGSILYSCERSKKRLHLTYRPVSEAIKGAVEEAVSRRDAKKDKTN